jgi:NADPH2:quinone reductase
MVRAVRFDRYGEIDVLEVRDVEQPSAAPDGVVVEVVATSINPGETMIRTGRNSEGSPYTFPMGEGSDLAGRIVEVGAEVSGWATGDEVIGWTDERAAQAEYVAVPSAQLTTKPAGISWEQAGSLYVAGGTAAAMRAEAAPKSGETVVVTAAAGGVGVFLVQLLAADGVRVLGVAGPDNDDWLRSVGAEPVNRGDDLADRLRAAAPDGIGAFLDCFGDGYTDLALDLGVPKEKVVTIADFGSAPDNGATVVFGYKSTTSDVLADLADRIARGDLDLPVAATYPLGEVRDAYTRLGDRHTRGKIVLTPASRA